MPEVVPEVGAEVVVVGSANVDLVLPVQRIPRPGETVLATGLTRGPGGKGANQAVASARAGASTAFVAALGDDDGGALLRAALAEAGVDLSLLQISQAPTGTAIITVDGAGENAITVAPSANATLRLTPAARSAVAGAKIVLSQLEIGFGTVQAAAEASAYFILNAAPAAELTDELLGQVDLLVVNETEAEAVAGTKLSALLDRVPAAVVTLGAEGALILTRDAAEVRVPAVPVEVVDTTAAGDTFCGVLAATLAATSTTASDLTNAVRRATVAASLSVQTAGAIPSVPHGESIDARCAEVYL
ncbi:PfkB domain protein [Kribbella flavida DSM 17836]|uniref:Ribokinase n=1 Tax=Kribbella flavida (strain DSM 17836 / JCM 10339 / NBRC 14399) TaxID=479435 RepID=D2PXX8_KRIFD|nr:ribokinase [Kribbella flavida]ADB33584.1 PfkB domain protein [Kribbella flavida DSM 17836]